METLAQQFLSKEQQKQVSETVHSVEKRTSGEIVPMIVSTSHHYPLATLIGALALALPSALLLSGLLARVINMPAQNMWVFIALYGVFFPLFFVLIKKNPLLQIPFLFAPHVEEEVREGAIKAFYSEQLYKTRDENGILIYISVFEKRVWILGDRGIDAKIDQSRWDEIVAELTEGIKTGNRCQSLCDAVSKVGLILEEFFPIQDDDPNELHDLIVK
ncbi:MAG: TPM domain-containing protein [Psychromonas sp.]